MKLAAGIHSPIPPLCRVVATGDVLVPTPPMSIRNNLSEVVTRVTRLNGMMLAEAFGKDIERD